MHFATAANRLRKMVMFDLLQRHNEDVCFRCGGKIESAAELSIEHKQPWFDVSTELFWDLSNIAFSHGRCNAVDRPHRTRRIGKDGEGWCNGCECFLPLAAFPRDKNGWNGLSYRCRDCKNRQKKEPGASERRRGYRDQRSRPFWQYLNRQKRERVLEEIGLREQKVRHMSTI
jgi:hypothetical protein